MCGLGGIVRPSGVRRGELDRLIRALRHRGPNGHGTCVWEGRPPRSAAEPAAASDEVTAVVGLAHTRLAVLDLTAAAAQPMTDPTGRYRLVFNGEIYNYRELRRELEHLGHGFTSDGDTAVLLAAWSAWGEACLRRLDGMYAFAVLDVQQRRLTLARDPLGIKPLYYAAQRGALAFCSEIPPLLDVTGVSRRSDPEGIRDYLLDGLSDHREQTLFADVKALRGGTLLRVDVGTAAASVHRHWEAPADTLGKIGREEAAGEVRARLLRSVQLQLRSDVPLGVALSGGLDSSAVLGAAVRAQGASGLGAFGFVPAGDAPSELTWMEEAVAGAGCALAVTTPTADELLRDLDHLVVRQGEPFGSTSIYAQHRVYGLARRHGTVVMLSGQGADELFAGYPSYIPSRVSSLLRRGHLPQGLALARRAGALPGGLSAGWHLSRGLVSALPRALDGPVMARQQTPAWVDRGWCAARGLSPARRVRRHGNLREALRADLTSTNLPALLRYEDRNSMTHSVEGRVPFLGRDLVDFALRLPEHLLVDEQARTKSVLRDAAGPVVPASVRDRRDKVAFRAPEAVWLKALGSWVDDALTGDTARATGILATWRRTGFSGAPRDPNALWRCVNLVRWTELLDVQH